MAKLKLGKEDMKIVYAVVATIVIKVFLQLIISLTGILSLAETIAIIYLVLRQFKIKINAMNVVKFIVADIILGIITVLILAALLLTVSLV